MKRVILESPYAGPRAIDLAPGESSDHTVEANLAYACRCIRDSLARGEAPIASHLLYMQPGILSDDVPKERLLGIEAGLAWVPSSVLMAVYLDLGGTAGMWHAVARAHHWGVPVDYRYLDEAP